MKKNYLAIFVLGLTSVFSSCVTVQMVSFDRLQAAEVNYPEQIRSVGIVNYMPLLQVDNKSLDITEGSVQGDGKITAEVLAQEIAATNYFNQVVICDSILRTTVSDSEWGQPIPGHRVDSLLEALDVDMLYAIESVHVQLKKSRLFLARSFEPQFVDAAITPLVRAYVAGRQTPLFTFSKSDTIYWEKTPKLTQETVLKEASEYAGIMPINYLLPYWKEVDRYYFDGGNVEMRDAGVYVREQNWEEAVPLWQKVYDTKKGKTKMHAAYNLALYYEMQGDLERTGEYLEAASSLAVEGSWEQQLILYYQMQLEDESKRNRHLQIQMKRFVP